MGILEKSRRAGRISANVAAAQVAVALMAAPGDVAAETTQTTPASKAGVIMTSEAIGASGAQWVWPAAAADAPNQYVHMSHSFEIQQPVREAKMAISVDTNYAVWMNGQFAGFGQWSNHPDDKTFDTLDLQPFARPGSNRLCILAWYQGLDSSQYRKGDAGALYAVQVDGRTVAASGDATLMRRAPDYVSGPVPLVTGQLGFTFEHHGTKLDNWLDDAYKPDASWARPQAKEMKPLASRGVRPRPVDRLVLGPRIPARIHTQGVFTRGANPPTVAVGVQTDALAWRAPGDLFSKHAGALPAHDNAGVTFKPEAWRGATGAYIVVDLGREEAGLLEVEADAPDGTVMDIAYGEHLEDMRVRAHVGGRNFAVRHVCGNGRHTFLHPFLRIAGRYLQVHITPPPSATDKPVTIHYAGMRPTTYPVVKHGAFTTSDSMHNRIWKVSERSLELCMHEHYEDCPWREQALYGMDGRNQMLAGYYCYGNYAFVAASLDLLAKGMNEEDGFLELCAPARVAVNIPSFSLAWILALDDYLLFSGDRGFVRTQLPVAKRLIERCSRESSGALVLNPQGKRMWQFYEWAPGLDSAPAGILDAPLNLFYVLALDAAARMERECAGKGGDYERRASELRAAFAPAFWDEKEQAFRTRIGDTQPPHFAELTQALALIAGVAPDGKADALRARLATDNNGLVPCTISHCQYKFEALLQDKDRYAPRVSELIERDWGMMISQGATSFWETIDGARAFGNAGSLCHGWSGVPAWFYGAYVLGIRPTAPGFASYVTDPVQGVFYHAEGRVPTPSGVLDVSCRIDPKTGRTTATVTRAK